MLIGSFYILGTTFTLMCSFYVWTEPSAARVGSRARKGFVDFVGCSTKTLLFLLPSPLEGSTVFEVYKRNWNAMAIVEPQCRSIKLWSKIMPPTKVTIFLRETSPECVYTMESSWNHTLIICVLFYMYVVFF